VCQILFVKQKLRIRKFEDQIKSKRNNNLPKLLLFFVRFANIATLEAAEHSRCVFGLGEDELPKVGGVDVNLRIGTRRLKDSLREG